jgi:hypothetical protein
MSSERIERLKQKRDVLLDEWKIRTEKVKRMRTALAIETNVATRYQFEQQIQEEESQLECLDKELQLAEDFIAQAEANLRRIAAMPDSEKLYGVLLRLNFVKQVALFRQFVEKHPVGACLIHGTPDCGQRWLLNRLVQLVPDGTTAKVIPFSLRRKARANYSEALWRELSGRVGLVGPHPPQKIVEAVCKSWQTQSVILVVQDVHEMPPEFMNAFICNFWQPIVKIAKNLPPQLRNYRLLMFLVDNDGCVEQWDVALAEVFDDSWEPHIPIKLPRINHLRHQDLVSWIENALNELPLQFTTNIEQTIRIILENSNDGAPQWVLENICSQCELNWYDKEQIWLKY